MSLAKQFLIDSERVRVSCGGRAPEVITGLHNPPPVAAHLAIDRNRAEFNTSVGFLVLLPEQAGGQHPHQFAPAGSWCVAAGLCKTRMDAVHCHSFYAGILC